MANPIINVTVERLEQTIDVEVIQESKRQVSVEVVEEPIVISVAGSVVGEAGPPGPPGLPGPPGAARRHYGDGPPTVVIGAAPGDEYVDRVTGDLYLLT